MAGSVVTVTHHKGGTGKTTTAINLAGFLAKNGRKVLLVDMDPQANATAGLGVDRSTLERSMYDVMVSELEGNARVGMKKIVLASDIDNLHIAPADLDLAGAVRYLFSARRRHHRLREALEPVRNYYDVIIVDTPPSPGPLFLNSLVAADGIIITLSSGIFALEGLITLDEILATLEDQEEAELSVLGVLVTQANEREKMTQRVMHTLGDMDHEILGIIPSSVKVIEAQVEGKPLSHTSPGSTAGKAYSELADRIGKWLDDLTEDD